MTNIPLKIKLLWHNWRYRRMWDKERWANWATIADMPLSKKELKKAACRGIVETRQIEGRGARHANHAISV